MHLNGDQLTRDVRAYIFPAVNDPSLCDLQLMKAQQSSHDNARGDFYLLLIDVVYQFADTYVT